MFNSSTMTLPDTMQLPSRRVSCVRSTLLDQSQAMALYALGAGMHLPSGLTRYLDVVQANPADSLSWAGTAVAVPLEELAVMHAALADLIAPATPKSVSLIYNDKQKNPRLANLGPAPIIRQMLLIAIISLALMLLVSLSPLINITNMQLDMLENHGLSLLMCELFLVFASALGSSFAVLFKLNKFISKGNYDPSFGSTYFTQLVLGIIAGVVLSQVIFHSMEGNNGTAHHRLFDQPILALIGGFSSSLVYRILNRILTAVESLFGTDSIAGDGGLQSKRLRQAVSRRTLPSIPADLPSPPQSPHPDSLGTPLAEEPDGAAGQESVSFPRSDRNAGSVALTL
jgi:hypothetical protein